MNNKKYFLLFLLAASPLSFGQFNPGARQVALAHSDLSYSSDSFSLFNNPAGLALAQSREIDLYYSPAPFGLTEMSNAYGAYSEPTNIGTFSAGFSIYGFELYKQTQVALGFGRKIYQNLFVGGTAIYQNISIKNYGSKGVLFLNLGGIANITNQLGFGFAVENLTRATVSDEANQIPTVFWGGLHLKVVKEFTFSAALSKEIGYNPSIRLGAEYSILDFIQLRFGTHSEPNTFSGGFGILYQFLQVDYSVAKHPDLGLYQQFGLIMRFSK
jgi:hypothetical protein